MLKIFAGVTAALVIAVGGYFGVEFYLQQRMASDIEAAFANVRASGAMASHGKIAFDLWSRTVTVADIAGEFTAQPPASVKIGRVVASGVSQQDAGRFAANRIEAAGVEVAGAIRQQAGLQFTYQVPRLEITDYAGPGGPLRPLDGTAAAAILRLPILKAHLGGGVFIGGWFSQGVLDLHLLPVDHEPEELCLHRRGLNRRPHLIDAERVGPVLIELPGKAVDGHLVPFCLFGTEFGEPCGHLSVSQGF